MDLFFDCPGLPSPRRFGHSTKDTAADGKLPANIEKQLPCQVTRGQWQMTLRTESGWAKIGSRGADGPEQISPPSLNLRGETVTRRKRDNPCAWPATCFSA
jgi:hypothetical protein